jgi:cysteine desulfuration protein SufE
MAEIPERLASTVEAFETLPDRSERIQWLIDIAERFREVPPEIARRPFAESHRVPACESEAYVWGVERQEGGLDLHFAVENPQGLSAKAMAVILKEGLAGARPEEIAAVSQDIVYKIFGNELSMGKSMGLQGMVSMVTNTAKKLAPSQSP